VYSVSFNLSNDHLEKGKLRLEVKLNYLKLKYMFSPSDFTALTLLSVHSSLLSAFVQASY
jgi:hypothetical protein